jgi:hypothetical protein
MVRTAILLAACLGVTTAMDALADPPAAPQSPAAPAAAAAPATPAENASPPSAAPKTTVVVEAEQDQLEKHFLAEGYKEEMHNGEKMLCRREQEMGSRLGAKKYCATALQLQETERESRAAMQRGMSQQTNPKGN